MFSNIGGKIKGLAKVLCWIGIIASLVAAIVLWSNNSRYQDNTLTGFIVLVSGAIGSWLCSLFTYGYGELIERTVSIDDKLNNKMVQSHGNNSPTGNSATDKDRKNRLSALQGLLDKGLITEEEYQERIKK